MSSEPQQPQSGWPGQQPVPPQDAPQPPPGYQAPPPGYQPPPPGYQAPPAGYQPPPPGYSQPPYTVPGQVAYANEAQDAEANKAMGVLAYVLFLIPLLAAPKNSRFARYHTNQGLVLCLAGIAYGIVWGILTAILSAVLLTGGVGGFGLYGLVSGILGIVWLVFPALAIVGIVNAVQGKTKPLPVIGGITLVR